MKRFSEFDAFRDRAASTLEAALTSLKEVQPVGSFCSTFSLSDMADLNELQSICKEIKSKTATNTSAIYCFELDDANAYSPLREGFLNRPSTNPQTGELLNYSRLIKEPNPEAIYVGSCKSFASRFSQHLGRTGGAGTYSMRLNLWAAGVPADVHLTVWFFDTTIDPAVLEILEQALWDRKRPMLGKRSGK